MVWMGCVPKGPYVGIFGLQIVVLFWKTLEHLGSGTLLEEVIDGDGSLSPLARTHFLSSLGFPFLLKDLFLGAGENAQWLRAHTAL